VRDAAGGQLAPAGDDHQLEQELMMGGGVLVVGVCYVWVFVEPGLRIQGRLRTFLVRNTWFHRNF
jgi:hypothetical protein